MPFALTVRIVLGTIVPSLASQMPVLSTDRKVHRYCQAIGRLGLKQKVLLDIQERVATKAFSPD
jgi:hypothetical protein